MTRTLKEKAKRQYRTAAVAITRKAQSLFDPAIKSIRRAEAKVRADMKADRKARSQAYSPKLGDLVYVQWIDARGCPMGWAIRNEIDAKPAEIESVGWVESLGDDYLCIAPHVGGSPTIVMGHIAVPMVCIKALRLMRPATSSFLVLPGQAAESGPRPRPTSSPSSISRSGASRSQLSRRASKSSRP